MVTRLRWWRRRATRQQWGEDLRASSGGGAAGVGAARGLPRRPRPRGGVCSVKFGCSTTTAGSFPADGLVGLSGDAVSLVTQLGGEASFGRRFSCCLVPHSVNTSSALNFGTLTNVTKLGAASTTLVAGDVDTYYTVVLDFVKVGNKTVASAASSCIINAKISFVTPANCK
uniref:Xylanase inhibitor N-terminal domain-containing protein n=1 Tax=Oryza barthii TaxID=65489 RepID=A0A0D3GT89_9ORYZ